MLLAAADGDPFADPNPRASHPELLWAMGALTGLARGSVGPSRLVQRALPACPNSHEYSSRYPLELGQRTTMGEALLVVRDSSVLEAN